MNLLLPLVASIFLNGVNIDGVRSQSFEKCKPVKIDERGDVHLDCPAYQVEAPVGQPAQSGASGAPPQQQAAQAAPLVPGQITKRYWLVTEHTESGAAQYDVDVFINSKWVRKVKAGDSQIVMEITKLLNPGQNKILFAATKHMEAGRKSSAASAYVKVTVGEGDSSGGNVMIDNPLFEYRRTAAETENVNDEYTITAR
ncbi:MAG: hypothetical protein JST92_15820 [Deltaproteobacteria bacterium]|nr:hypothetical protein [Deltaproteobacteria bacterium]